MEDKPVAAGKSSFDLIDRQRALAHIIADGARTYLDLACGVGNYSLALAAHLPPQCEILAMDLWAEGVAALVQSARERGYENIAPMQVDITQPLPLESGAVDVCLLATVLHDLPIEDRDRTLAEIRRVLAVDGALAIIEFKKLDHGPGPRKAIRIAEDELEQLLTRNRFAKDTTTSLGEHLYLTRFTPAP